MRLCNAAMPGRPRGPISAWQQNNLRPGELQPAAQAWGWESRHSTVMPRLDQHGSRSGRRCCIRCIMQVPLLQSSPGRASAGVHSYASSRLGSRQVDMTLAFVAVCEKLTLLPDLPDASTSPRMMRMRFRTQAGCASESSCFICTTLSPRQSLGRAYGLTTVAASHNATLAHTQWALFSSDTPTPEQACWHARIARSGSLGRASSSAVLLHKSLSELQAHDACMCSNPFLKQVCWSPPIVVT